MNLLNHHQNGESNHEAGEKAHSRCSFPRQSRRRFRSNWRKAKTLIKFILNKSLNAKKARLPYLATYPFYQTCRLYY